MNLPRPPQKYDQGYEAKRNLDLEQMDRMNLKRNADIELTETRLILRSPDGSRFAITVADDGTLSSEDAGTL